MTGHRPHDLLRIADVARLSGDAPSWVAAALAVTPWVVVRRGRAASGRVAVGIRGTGRARRYGTEMHTSCVVESLSPPDLLSRAATLPDVPAAAALRGAADVLGPAGLPSGPTGSTGFTLATGHIAVTAASDLDLVVRVASLPPLDVLTDWHRAFERLPARVDCQIDLPAGALALAEVVKADRVLLKTRDGPVLVESHRLWP